MEELTQLLGEEIDLIKDADLKAFAAHAFKLVPGYFWFIPASSSGKYHPRQSLGEGGLLRHTKIATRVFANTICRSYLEGGTLSQKEADLCTLAILLHDTFKRGADGKQQYCKPHGAIAANFFLAAGRQYFADNPSSTITDDDLKAMCSAIAHHMGPWTVPSNGGRCKAFPEFTLMERLVHTADMIAADRSLVMTSVEDPTSVSIA